MTIKNIQPLVLAASLLLAAALLLPRNAGAEIERIEKEELSAKLCSLQIILLDVRTGEVWEKSKIKIKCSRRVDPYNVESWINTIPKDKDIVLYCCSWSGNSSARVAKKMIKKGFTNVKILEGGWKGWLDAKLPIEAK